MTRAGINPGITARLLNAPPLGRGAQRSEAGWVHRSCVLAAMVLLACFSTHADQIVISGIAQPGVEIFKIERGGIVYLTAAGTENNTPLSQVDAVYVERVPQLEQADKALAAGESAKAVTLYQQALRGAGNVPWLQQWITHRLVAAQDAAGQGVAAVEGYASLVTGGADPALAMTPPTASATRLSDADKQRLAPVIDRLQRNAPGSLSKPIDQLAQAVAVANPAEQPPADAPLQRPTANPPAPTSPSAAPVPAASPSPAPSTPGDLRLPAQLLVSDNPVLAKLRAGLFAESAEDLKAQLKVEQTRLADRLFLLGVAERGVAEGTGNPSDYLDAALSFMKVAIYYPSSNLAAPALLEAGDAHRRAGLEEQADKLIEEGRAQLDEEAEPVYARWLNG